MPGGNPVTDEPGETPMLPLMTVAPVLVMVDPARTAKFCDVPSGTCANAAEALKRNAAIPMIGKYVRFIVSLLFFDDGETDCRTDCIGIAFVAVTCFSSANPCTIHAKRRKAPRNERSDLYAGLLRCRLTCPNRSLYEGCASSSRTSSPSPASIS